MPKRGTRRRWPAPQFCWRSLTRRSCAIALRDLADVARVGQVSGSAQDSTAILQGELGVCPPQCPGVSILPLTAREIEQAVVAVFLHSQPTGANRYAHITELTAMVGMARPDRITVEKALQAWAERSWYLDEIHLDSADKRPDGTRGLPKTWRLGNQPNLKRDCTMMLRVNQVAVRTAVEATCCWTRSRVRAGSIKGASALGARVHKLPSDPEPGPRVMASFVTSFSDPNAVSESGKPSAPATRFCEEVSRPR